MTEAIYLEVTEKAEAAHKAKRRVSVSGMLKYTWRFTFWLSRMAETCSFQC